MFVNHYERNVTSCIGEEINFSFLKKTNIIPLVLYCHVKPRFLWYIYGKCTAKNIAKDDEMCFSFCQRSRVGNILQKAVWRLHA